MSYLRKGENTPIRTGRAARTRVGNHTQRATIAYRNAGHLIARDYLTSLGAEAEFVATYESAFGRATAKTYREQHQAEPDNGGAVLLRGRIYRTNRYADAADLDAGARAYKRTAELMAQRTEAPAKLTQASTAPAVLVAELAARYALTAAFIAQRTEAILDTMRSNPRLYDARRGLLTDGGARVVRSVIAAEDTEGLLTRQAPRLLAAA